MTGKGPNPTDELFWPQFARVWLVAVAFFATMFHFYEGAPSGWRALGLAAVVAAIFCIGFGFWAYVCLRDDWIEWRQQRKRVREGARGRSGGGARSEDRRR